MNKNNKPIIAAIIIVALLIIIGAVFASGILAHDDDEQAAYEVNFIDGEQVIKTITVKENHLVTRINDPVKEGYIFAGWYTDQELTNEFTFDDTYITNNLTLYAKWVKTSEPEPGDITYTVTFNTNGANSISPQIVKAGDKAVKPADPLKSGYKFVGWYSDSSFTTLFDFQSPITFDITLYAKFTSTGGGGGSVTPPVTDTKFTVTFETNGGTSVLPQSVVKGALATEPTAPTKEGYTFAGWYEQNSSIKFDFNTPIISNLTLSAKWSIYYEASDSQATVELSTDSNTAQEQIEQLVSNGKIELVNTSANEKVNEVIISSEVLGQVQKAQSDDPKQKKDVIVTTAQGSIALSSNVVDQLISTAQSSTGNQQDNSDISITITADNEQDNLYHITIKTNDDTPVTKFSEPITISIPYTKQEGENPQDIAVYYIKGNERILVHGTYSEETKCVEITTNHLSTYEIKNTAQYAVIFDSNGGTLSIEDLLKYSGLEFNSKIVQPANPTKDGYTFKGWFKDKDCTQAWNFDSDTVRGESYEITLYAKWTPISYEISYNLDGGVNNSNNPASYTIESDTITLQSPTKTGHTFLGWFDKNDHKVTSIVKGSTGDLQLTAMWEIKQYTVTLASGENYTLEPLAKNASTVNHGDNFSFTVADTPEGSLNLAVKANGQIITPANGIYTITNITEDQIVTVEGVNSTNYKVTFVPHEGYIANSSSDTVAAGESFSFTIELTDAYSQSSAIEVMAIGYGKLTAQNGIYTVANVNADLIIYLNGLQKNTYTVTFDYDNGSDAVTQQIKHGDKVSKPSTPVKTGYLFEQWTAGETEYDFNTPVTSDLLLKAKWNALTSAYYVHIYQETLNKGDYTLHSVTRQSGTTDSELTPSDLYQFEGFNYNSEKSINDSDKTIKADGSSILKIYYDRNSYDLTYMNGDATVSKTSKRYGETILPPISVTQEGYILSGWYESDPETPYLFSIMPAKDVTLYANWIKIYKVTYDANGGSGELPLTVGYAANTTIYVFGPGYPTEGSYQLTREGYTFGGWAYDGVVYHPGEKLTVVDTNVTLTAVWIQTIFDIELDKNITGGSVSFSNNHVAAGTEIVITVTANPGYELESLSVKTVNGSEITLVDNKFTMPESNVIISAIFTPLDYTITFVDWNNSVISSETYHYGDTVNIPDNPQRDADEKYTYAFVSWTPAVVTVTEDATYQAVYAPTLIEYDITYELDGGINSADNPASYNYESAAILLKDPVKEGYNFQGWFTDADFINKVSTIAAGTTGNLTLYTKWDINTYQVTFHPNNNSKEYTANVIFEELVPSQDVSKKGYTLEGWYTDADLTNKWDFTTDTMPAENIDLYANWTLDTYTINLYNGDELFKSIEYTIETGPMDLPEISQEGYTFTGWFEKGSSSEFFYSPGVTVGDIDVYANLKINQYTITFDSNGGSNAGSVTQDYDSTLGPLPTPTYDGHKFLGWFEDNGTFSKEFTATTMPAKDITLYAKWELNKYTLTINYVDKDGTQLHAAYSDVLEHGTEYSISSPAITNLLPDKTIVAGIMTSNLTVMVTYAADYVANLGSNNFQTLEEALAAAVAGDKVILIQDYTLAQNVTVPKDVFLVLPCAADDQGYDLTAIYEKVHNPDGTSISREDLSVLYRTLTIPSDVILNVEGQVLVNAVTGRPAAGHFDMDITGGYAQILLEGNIIVKYGGILEVCGYVTGNGQVTAEAGAEVRDMYIVQNWRGGSQAFEIFPDIYPYSEYNCHNIQSDLLVNSGASLLGNVKMYAQNSYHYTRFPQVNNDNGMIRLNDGAHLLKSYDADVQNGSSPLDKGRTTIEIYGGAKFSHSTLMIVGLQLSTKAFIYPIDGDLSFGLHDGDYVIENSFKALTGVEVTLYENSSLTLNATYYDGDKYVGNTLVLYDEFNDVDNTSTTEYPIRPAATLRLMDNSTFNIYGNFAGTICFDGMLGNAIVNANDALSLEIDTIEANGYLKDAPEDYPRFVNLHFETKYQYAISFNSNGGSEQSPIKYFVGDEIELPTPEKTGSLFVGWYLDVALTQLCNPDDITSGNITLYAKWDVSKYTVSFVSNGGSSVADQIINHNEAAEKPNDPTRSGFKFIAWYADQELTEVYDFTTSITGKTTLYAKWEAIEYTISFVTNNEETLEAVKYTTADNSLSLKELSKTGYDFQGWYLDEDLTSLFTFKQYETVGNLTLYAKWSPTAYTIKYYDGIQLNLAPNSYSIEETVTLPTPEKTGYVFAGWHEKSDLSDEAVFTISKGTSGNRSYYASWTAEPFAIIYFDGSNTLSLSPNTYTILENVVLPTAAKDGYTFGGWYNNADCTGNKITSIPIGSSGAKVFYAKFTANQYTISFNSNGGSAVGNITADYGTSIDEPAAPVKTGYTFAGWYKDAEFTQTWDFAADTVPVNGTTLYAKWTLEVYTIDFYKDNELVKSVKYSVESDSIEMPSVSKEGYTFDNWYLAAAIKPFEYVKGTTVGDFDLHASFIINQYTISFNSNGGTGVTAITTYYGITIDEPTAPVKTGYTFAGWFKDADCLTAWNFEVDTVPAGDTTLHAKWIANSYTVVFHANNGTDATTSQNFKYGEAQNLMVNTFTKEGYNFLGWSESSSGDVKYADKLSVTNLTADDNGTIDLYAVWTAQIFSVIYNNNGGEGSIENTSATYDSTVVLNNGANFSRVGHSLTAWNTMTDGSGREYALDYKFEPWKLTENLTLYAQWTVNSSTISFNSNGGTEVAAITANYDTTIAAPTAPEKEGHTFAGWYTDEALKNEYIFTTMPAESITLYAKWTVNQYTVTYKVNGEKYKSYEIDYGEAVTKPADPTKTGYTFKDWGAEIPATMPAENITFNAVFDINQYTITYWIDNEKVETQTYNFGATITAYQPASTEGKTFSGWSPELPETMPDRDITVSGSFNANTYTITYYVDENQYGTPLSVEFGETITPMDQPTKEGHTFSGWVWYKVENGAETELETAPATMPACNLAVRGSFTINTYEVTFHPNNIDKDSTVPVNYGSLIEVPSVSAKKGYTLEGWCTDVNLTNKWDFTTNTMPAENIDLYANWTLDTYTINFYNGTESVTSIKYTIETKSMTLPEISQEGYTFTGWFEKDSSSAFFYSPGVTVGDKDLYANLKINHYTITFNSNGGSNVGSITQDYNTNLDPLPTPTYDGYKFMGWFEDNGTFNIEFTATTMPAGDITLYAKWEAISYSITYELDDGKNNSANPTSYTVETATITLQNATKEGYTFDGWYSDKKLTELVSQIATGTTGNLTFYAKFTPNTYTVIFNANGGTGTMENQEFTYDVAQNLAPNTFTKDGYDFQGWSESSSGDVKYADKVSVTNLTANDNGAINLYAVWQINEYTISFNSNGGSAVDKITANYGTTITAPTAPEKEGHTFAGWYTDDALKNEYTFTTMPAESITLYAKWTANQYTITFNSNGGTEVAAINADYGTKIAEPTAPAKDGYNFAGWYKDAEFTQAWDFATDTVPVNGTTLYAQWTAEEYTITFNSDGAGAIDSITYTIGKMVDLLTPVKTGYTFIGWYNGNQEFTYVAGTTIGDYNLTAHWEATNYAIIYKDGENTISGLQPDSYTYEAAKTLATNATKEGYTFGGWYETIDCMGAQVTEIPAQSVGDKTFYAKFTPNKYAVIFNANGGTGTMENQEFTYDVAQNLAPNTFTKEGYDFQGWSNPDTETNYANTQNVTNLVPSGSITLYAVWGPTSYSISYNLNGGSVSSDNPLNYTIESDTITLTNPTQVGYTFAGWTGTDLAKAQMTVEIAKGSIGNREYIANWTANTYTVHFEGNGATSGSIRDQKFVYGEEQALTENSFVKDGHTFVGWSETAEGSKKYDNQQPVVNLTSTNGGKVTLYAVWSINHYQVTLPNNELAGVTYTVEVADGYDPSSIAYGGDFKFTITFNGSLGSNNPVIVFGDSNINASSSTGNTYNFTISAVTGNLQLSVSLVNNPTAALEKLVNNDTSVDYHLSLSGTTLTVSIINPKVDAAGLISKISEATGGQTIAANSDSGRTDAASTFLAYLPNDNTLWADNLAEYAVELSGYRIIFKQDSDAVEEAKLTYFLQIEQLCRLARDDLSSAILSAYIGMENDEKYFKVISKNDNETFFNGLMANFSVPFALVGHPDAVYGCYTMDQSFTTAKVRIGIDRAINDQYNLYSDAMKLLKNMNVPITGMNGKISQAFMDDGTGYGGYGQYYCTSSETGIRYTDVYHLSFDHYDVSKYGHHSLVVDNSLSGVTTKHLGYGPNESLDDNLIFEDPNSLSPDWFNNTFKDPLLRWYVYVAVNNSALGAIPTLNADYTNEHTRLAAGELVVIDFDQNSGYTMNDLTVTSTTGEIIWISNNSFIMPNGDVTISSK